jgi:hypothetical protein
MFPNVPHDDEVDAMTQYVNWRRTRGGAMSLFQAMREEHESIGAQPTADPANFFRSVLEGQQQ